MRTLFSGKRLLLTNRRHLWQRRGKFFDKSQSLFVHCPSKLVRNGFLQKVLSFTKLVPQTLRTQFRQKRSKFSPWRRKLFAQHPKEIWKYETFPEMSVSSNCSQGHVEGSFDINAGNVLLESKKISHNVQKRGKWLISQKYKSLQDSPTDTKKPSSDNAAKKFSTKGRKILSDVWNQLKNKYWIPKPFSHSVPMDT